MFGKQEEVRFHPAFALENLGADVGLLGDVVIRDKGLNIEGVGSGLGIIQLIVPFSHGHHVAWPELETRMVFPFSPSSELTSAWVSSPWGSY